MESSVNSIEKRESTQEENFIRQLEEMLVYGASYVDARIDGLKSSARESFINLFTEFYSVFFGIMISLIAVSFFIYGIAMGIGLAFGGKLWLGFIITGGGIFLGKLFFSKYLIFKTRKKSVKNKIKKYEEELKIQREKFGHDMSCDIKMNKELFQSEKDFLIWKTVVAKSAFLKTSHNLKQKFSEKIDVKKLTQEYPFYSTGLAAATGFVIAGGITSQNLKEVASLTASSEKSTLEEKSKDANSIKLVFATMLIAVAEDVLKETVVPFVKEQFSSVGKTSI